MTDITAPTVSRRRPGSADASVERATANGPDTSLVRLVELLFFAYRDFTGEADAILAEIGFGRAHHRVLHFVNRNPGLRVADLLGILKITKQSLARVLKQLVDQGFIVQSAGERDRRERRLTLTEKGEALAGRLVTLQAQRIAEALAIAGPAAQDNVRQFLFAMIGAEDRHGVAALMGTPELAF